MADVSIHAAAEAEYEAALAWYLARSARAANRFEAAFHWPRSQPTPSFIHCVMADIGSVSCVDIRLV